MDTGLSGGRHGRVRCGAISDAAGMIVAANSWTGKSPEFGGMSGAQQRRQEPQQQQHQQQQHNFGGGGAHLSQQQGHVPSGLPRRSSRGKGFHQSGTTGYLSARKLSIPASSSSPQCSSKSPRSGSHRGGGSGSTSGNPGTSGRKGSSSKGSSQSSSNNNSSTSLVGSVAVAVIPGPSNSIMASDGSRNSSNNNYYQHQQQQQNSSSFSSFHPFIKLHKTTSLGSSAREHPQPPSMSTC